MNEDLDYFPRRGSSWHQLPHILRQLGGSSDRIDPADVAAANADMARLELRTRYRPDGTPYQVDANG